MKKKILFWINSGTMNIFGLAKYLKKNKIETRNTFNLVHKMPMYFKKSQKNLFPNAQILSNTGLSLPSGPNLSKLEIRKISSF